ncbi:AtpZ/AtpI family protein [Stappia taiwanensis]|uniref:ATP synthase protein I n=1 Tax=Stappia taiwanensis TaxID=992267 RepID=A0A838XKX7_9HYPH|nr:AtpZ/AtpI family protein [Stappia taiwanensis]GGE92076.1 ATP synthase protein I [Stappia taiwanensis]
MPPSDDDSGRKSDKPVEAELSERMDRLVRALEEKNPKPDEPGPDASSSGAHGYVQAMKLSTEFVAGILVGAAIGWVIDSGFGTGPWGLIVFLLLGFLAGVLNVLRSAGLVAEPFDKSRDG